MKKYRIEEMSPVTGKWNLIDEESKGMTQEECKEMFDFHVRNEVNPNYLRVVREQ